MLFSASHSYYNQHLESLDYRHRISRRIRRAEGRHQVAQKDRTTFTRGEHHISHLAVPLGGSLFNPQSKVTIQAAMISGPDHLIHETMEIRSWSASTSSSDDEEEEGSCSSSSSPEGDGDMQLQMAAVSTTPTSTRKRAFHQITTRKQSSGSRRGSMDSNIGSRPQKATTSKHPCFHSEASQTTKTSSKKKNTNLMDILQESLVTTLSQAQQPQQQPQPISLKKTTKERNLLVVAVAAAEVQSNSLWEEQPQRTTTDTTRGRRRSSGRPLPPVRSKSMLVRGSRGNLLQDENCQNFVSSPSRPRLKKSHSWTSLQQALGALAIGGSQHSTTTSNASLTRRHHETAYAAQTARMVVE